MLQRLRITIAESSD